MKSVGSVFHAIAEGEIQISVVHSKAIKLLQTDDLFAEEVGSVSGEPVVANWEELVLGMLFSMRRFGEKGVAS